MTESINVIIDDSIIESGHDVKEDVETSFQMNDDLENAVDADTNTETEDTEPDENQSNKIGRASCRERV